MGEVTKQTQGKGTSILQKTQNVNNERGLYIPSVDLLTAQVNSQHFGGKGRKGVSTWERVLTLLVRGGMAIHGSGKLKMGRLAAW